MAKMVIECTDPNDLKAIEEATQQLVGRCNITYFKQHQEMVEADISQSKAESARLIAEETGETPKAVRHRIDRGDQEFSQLGKTSITDQDDSGIGMKSSFEHGGRRESAGRTPKHEKPRPVFNETNESIEWARWTWNPVTGCKHGCEYCYARDIANRFYEEGFRPTYRPERLEAPKNTKLTSLNTKFTEQGNKTVFVCSMADLLGDWIPKEWISSIINVTEEYSQWEYLFLTKNPKRYIEFKWPSNCWLGVTGDTQERVNEAMRIFSEIKIHSKTDNILFLSCEPLSESIKLKQESEGILDWIIIGGRSQNSRLPAMQPELEWVESLNEQAKSFGIKRYWKPNLTVRPREYPVK